MAGEDCGLDIAAILTGPLDPRRLLERWADTDGGAYLNPIADAVARLSRRARAKLPHYLKCAYVAYISGQPFSCLALHDAFTRYVSETPGVPAYTWGALADAERSCDLAMRDTLDYLGPEAPYVATNTSLPDDEHFDMHHDRFFG